MATFTSKYFVLTPQNGNQDFLDFDLRYGTLNNLGEKIQYNGSGQIDSIFVRPGLSYDLTNTAGNVDKIYLTGNLSDYTRKYNDTDLTLTLSRTVDNRPEEVIVAAGNSGNFDNLVFNDGTVKTYLLAAASTTLNPAPVPALDTSETSQNPVGAASPTAVLDTTIKAYSNNSAAANMAGETFATTKPGIKFVVNGGLGIDTVYVADGEHVDATNLGGSVDLIYLRGKWADYTKALDKDNPNYLVLTRMIGGHEESVTVALGNSGAHDKLIFADGALNTNLINEQLIKKIPADLFPTIPGYEGGIISPIYSDKEKAAALKAIADRAHDNLADSTNVLTTTYDAAGVSGVTLSNLGAINSALNSQRIDNVDADETTEVQKIVDAYKAILTSADGPTGTNSATALTSLQYTAIGISDAPSTSGAGSALQLLNSAVDVKMAMAVGTEAQVQAIVTAANHVMAAVGGNAAALGYQGHRFLVFNSEQTQVQLLLDAQCGLGSASSTVI